MIPRVLTIAGTDPTGGAGVQADIKSIAAAGGFSYSVVTSLVAQNTQGVRAIHTPPLEFLRAQLECVASDVAIDAIKIGMLGSAEVAEVIREFVATQDCPVVLDPVMVATSGDALLADAAEDSVRELTHHASLVTPNLSELAVLAQSTPASTLEAAIAQAKQLAARIDTYVLVKGGHLRGALADNALVSPTGDVQRFPVTRVDTKNTHGTGCSLSSAIATKLADGWNAASATKWATRWLHEAIRNADALEIGHGNGPVDHTHTLRRMARSASTQPWTVSNSAATSPLMPPAGPHTARLWDAIGGELTDILELSFVRDLGAGSLPNDDFYFYVAQDAAYLTRYAHALRVLGGGWADDADGIIDVENELHERWLKGRPEADLSPVTRAYTDFLLSAVYVQTNTVGEAAVLPCYWLYYEVGARFAARNHDQHPYNAWLATYAGDDFADSTREAIARVEASLERNPHLLDEAAEAFRIAARCETLFFAQSDHAWIVP
ncbi:bifunctional hydroxymethylpyrimidine kinase/phosphomethylpyrimidine kinase [Corynebacterium sp. LK2510]|uniref:bifunctional hydroxymethylpyrimidine kinase/phosphomethylpyrimidine kinase n=1 Tax=Corynebacterium sp. LK2510 TaxID=3110472 RepID=UPI0034CDD9CB